MVCKIDTDFTSPKYFSGILLMTIEAMGEQRREPVAHVHRVGYANRAIRKKKCKRTKKCASTVPMALQDLFVSCRQMFKGPDTVPLPEDIKRLCNILGRFLYLMVFILVPFVYFFSNALYHSLTG